LLSISALFSVQPQALRDILPAARAKAFPHVIRPDRLRSLMS